MAKRDFLAGATSQTMDVFIQDTSVTNGDGLSGLAFNTSGLKAYYRKGATGTMTAITLATQTVGGAWSSGGFVEIDATNAKGLYRFDIPDTILASTPYATITFYGATNMARNVSELQIVSYNPFDGVRLGLTALPNAAAGANGGLPLSVDASGRVDVLKINGTGQTGRDIGLSVLLSSGTGTGQIKIASGYVAPNWGDVGNQSTTVNLSATTINQAVNVTTVSGDVVGNIQGNLDGSVGGGLFGTVAALSITSVAEPTGAPAASATLSDKISFLYEALRNKITVDGTSKKFFDDSGTLQWSKALSDNGTTFTEAEGA